MTTFSQLVDEMVLETKRPDMSAELATYLNQTIREVHFEPSRGNVVFYRSNFREDEVVTTLDVGQGWTIPDLSIFQGLAVVQFASLTLRDGSPVYAVETQPGPMFNIRDAAWYQSGDRIYFGGASGYGGVGASILLGWYEYPKSLKYKTLGTRPAQYDVETGWTYHVDYDVDDSTREVARNLVTNWLLQRWTDVLREGVRAKIYKRLSDETRQRTSYSLYSQLRQGLFTSEAAKLPGVV